MLQRAFEIEAYRMMALLALPLAREQGMLLAQANATLALAAIVYYVVGIIGVIARALHGAGWRIDPDRVEGMSIPIVVVLLMVVSHRLRRNARSNSESV